jgi:hypothetical protein
MTAAESLTAVVDAADRMVQAAAAVSRTVMEHRRLTAEAANRKGEFDIAVANWIRDLHKEAHEPPTP